MVELCGLPPRVAGAWLGIVGPCNIGGLIGQAFGVGRLASLFGITMFVHQIGSFLGVWLGGIAFAATGGYDAFWWADAGLALVAAVICLWVREPAAIAAAPVAAAAAVPVVVVAAAPPGRWIGPLGELSAAAALRARRSWRRRGPVHVTIPAAARAVGSARRRRPGDPPGAPRRGA